MILRLIRELNDELIIVEDLTREAKDIVDDPSLVMTNY